MYKKHLFNRSNRNCFLLSAGLYILTFLIGFVAILPIADLSIFSLSCFDTASKTPQVNETVNSLFIIKNNLFSTLIMLSGSFMLGFTSFTILSLNGLTFGTTICSALKNGVPYSTLFLLFFPHGIFEVPAIWIAGAAGFKIPYEIVKYFSNKKDYILSKDEIMGFLALSVVSIVLIIVAAFVEANVTMRIAGGM